MATQKFRAWIPQAKEWIENVDLRDLWQSGRALEEHGTSRYEAENIRGISWKFDDLIFVEFTGLKDKNGKEGFDDDLVKMFNRSLFRIVRNEYYARFQLELVKGDEFIKVHDMGMLQFSEIVGNIYENPDLLEK